VTGGPSADDRRSIFITGGASGIGRATATFFAERGWFVGAYDVDAAGLASLGEELGSDRCLTRRLDVIDKPDFDRAMREFSDATGGRMDLLFNNAGIGGGGCVYAGIPLLERTPNSLCFSTSSSAALFGMPRAAMYAATKFAVKGLTEALSVELSRFGSRAADVLPALIDTPILEATPDYSSGERPGIAMRKNATSEGAMRLVQPEEVAALVWRAYGSDRVHWYIPEEMAKVEAARAGGVEPLRDQFKKTVLGGA
jgi:NAD(P)-dependent dehydrogenase (short-subunit alcohol dehydrogenase family)